MTQTAGLPRIPEVLRAAVVPVVPGLPVPEPGMTQDGLCPAVLTDPDGAVLYWGWIPRGARLVARGQRIFMHFSGREWRQVMVVELGDDGRPI